MATRRFAGPRRRGNDLTTALRPEAARSRAPRLATARRDLTATDAHLTVLNSLDEAKAEDIVSIDIIGKSPLGDYMIVASGRSPRHVGAIAERLMEDLKEAGAQDIRVEGLRNSDWVLIDTGDVIVHIFRPEVRSFYNIEKMWQADQPAGPIPV